MQRYFTDNIKNNRVILSNDDSYHIKRVMRMSIGDNIEIVYDNSMYICKIVDISDLVVAEIVDKMDEYNELSTHIVLAQSLVKEQKMDMILQKNTELGAYGFIPLDTTRSVVKMKKNETKKIDRWKKIVKEACEQSKRCIIPEVYDVMTINELSKMEGFDLKLLCSVKENTKKLKKVLSNYEFNGTMLIVVGSEGGFTNEEEDILMKNGFIRVSLGKSVLRTETAGIFITSSIRYLDME